MNKTEIIEAIKKLSKMCGNTLCEKCDFCDKATGECVFARAITIPSKQGDRNILVPPSDWDLWELCNNK